MMDKVNNATKCNDAKCGHIFGEHFETYDGRRNGCAWQYDTQKDGLSTCNCDGFKIIFRYNRLHESMQANGSLGAMADADPLHGPYGGNVRNEAR
jgi:hypothetical protein